MGSWDASEIALSGVGLKRFAGDDGPYLGTHGGCGDISQGARYHKVANKDQQEADSGRNRYGGGDRCGDRCVVCSGVRCPGWFGLKTIEGNGVAEMLSARGILNMLRASN